MDRRKLLQLSLMAALSRGTPASAQAAGVSSAKKGLGIGIKSKDWEDRLKELRVKWFYTWNYNIPDGAPEGSAFVPMVWGAWKDPEPMIKAAEAAKAAGIKELLGFNEPDQKKQSNISVEQALALWPLLEKSGLRIGSPGCVQPDGDWMKAFMPAAAKQKLKIDFVCVHSYGGPSADALVKRLEMIHKLYGKPIWITEFAVGDWNAKSVEENRHKPESVLRFMEQVLPRLEKLDYVERYAWFPAARSSVSLGTSALFDETGKLTRLGECYRDG